MRERVTEFIPANEIDLQIKLGPGGLRDIEFTVQLLQLVHGRTDNTVHQRDTIGAIHALSQGGYIGRSEANEFASHYRFLRLLEHRIQMSEMRRTHLMPTSDSKRRALARAVDLKLTAESLIQRWESVKVDVRALHQKIFYRPLLSAVSKLGDDSLSLSTDQVRDRLHAPLDCADRRGGLREVRVHLGDARDPVALLVQHGDHTVAVEAHRGAEASAQVVRHGFTTDRLGARYTKDLRCEVVQADRPQDATRGRGMVGLDQAAPTVMGDRKSVV